MVRAHSFSMQRSWVRNPTTVHRLLGFGWLQSRCALAGLQTERKPGEDIVASHKASNNWLPKLWDAACLMTT